MNRPRTPEQQAKLFKKQVFKQPRKWVQHAFRHAVMGMLDQFDLFGFSIELPVAHFYAGLSLRLISMVNEPTRSELLNRREEAYRG